MCGIAGVISPNISDDAVDRMVAAMHHRGPDDCGHVMTGGPVAKVFLGNTRLAIIDLSSAGHMPMNDALTGNWITYNGEVYNFEEVKAELAACGDTFQSNTDTEVILRAYARWGRSCVDRLQGMFAFALWDQSVGELFIVRDRLGKKPVYYFHRPDLFVFASEVRTVLSSGLVESRLNPAALESYLFNGFVVSPETIVAGVSSLLPGHWMRVGTKGAVLETRAYWQLPDGSNGPASEHSVEEIRQRLDDAVRMRLVSDVPLGAFLSGGLDSSVIVALMARHGGDVRTFSVTFDEPEYDESAYSNWVAGRFGTRHTEVRLRRSEFEDWLPDALGAVDQPTFDGLNTYFVSRAARQSGLKVALTGAGGDELFGGYDFFTQIPPLVRLAWAGRHMPSAAGSLVQRWLGAGSPRLSGPVKTLELLQGLRGHASSDDIVAAYQTAQMHFPAWMRETLRLESARSEQHLWYGLPDAFRTFLGDMAGQAGSLDAIGRLATRLFLGERCLRDIDAVSMSVSLEVRAPFTDHRLIEAVAQVAAAERCSGAPDKPFEWRIAQPYLGADYPYRRKQGFIFPFQRWLNASSFQMQFQDLLNESGLVAGIGLNLAGLQTVFHTFQRTPGRIPWSRVWSLFVLMHWCRQYGVRL